MTMIMNVVTHKFTKYRKYVIINGVKLKFTKHRKLLKIITYVIVVQCKAQKTYRIIMNVPIS